MATKKRAKKAAAPAETKAEPVQRPAPHEINSSLASDRMQALLADHQAMGARPK